MRNFAQRLLHAVSDRLGNAGLRTVLFGQFLGEPLGQIAESGQLLAQAVVQFAADSLLLAAGDFQHFAFEVLAGGDVAGDDRDAHAIAGAVFQR